MNDSVNKTELEALWFVCEAGTCRIIALICLTLKSAGKPTLKSGSKLQHQCKCSPLLGINLVIIVAQCDIIFGLILA